MIKRAIPLVALITVVCVAVPLAGRQTGNAAAPITGGRVHKSFQPKDGKIFVLIIGSDARSGNPNNVRADGIHLAGVNTKTMKGGILNFPRDSWVNIPGSGTGRINEALTRGGPELVARTVESLTGIRIDYWIMTGFEGFTAAIRKLGGVRMSFPRGFTDPAPGSGVNIPRGAKWIAAPSALAYVRARKSLPNGDVDRTTNHGKFLLALLRKLRDQVDRKPTALFDWMSIARNHTRLDIPADELFGLGVLASQIKPGDVGNVTVPVRVGSAGAASVVFIQPQARSIYKRFKEKGSL